MKKLYILVLLATIISCANNKKTVDKPKSNLHYIELENAIDNRLSQIQSLKDFIDTTKYICLETNPNCLIEKIQKILLYKGNFFISDFNTILKFDANGNFICKIGNKGRGPKEYSRNSDMFVYSDTLFVNARDRIVGYNINNGGFLISYPFRNKTFLRKLRESFVTFNPRNGYVEFVDYEGKLLDSINFERFKGETFGGGFGYPFHNIFFGTHESLKISTSHNDTIFELNNEHTMTPRYILDMRKYKLSDNKRFEYIGDFDKFDKITEGLIRPIPLETNRFLLIQFGKWATVSNIAPIGMSNKRADLIGLGVFDKRDNNFSIVSDDIENYPCFYPHFSDLENSLISFVNPIEVINFFNKNKNRPYIYKPFVAVIEKIKMDDNPIIIVVKLKE